MANWADTHKMTGVGSALKRHYQGLLLDYELAHPQDVNTQASVQHDRHFFAIAKCTSGIMLRGNLFTALQN